VKSAHLHWLLQLMAINAIPLTWIVPRFNGKHTNARPIANYEPEEYAQLVISALREGLIELQDGRERLSFDDATAAITELEGYHLEKPGSNVVCRLTDAGGKAWEALAEPQWERFIKLETTTQSSDLNNLEVHGLLASQSLDVVVAYLGWYARLESIDVRWETLRITTHGSYHATYWKRLPDVHEACFLGALRRTDLPVPVLVWDWKTSLGTWFTQPWDRPDWS
jgi:hypothetical protein